MKLTEYLPEVVKDNRKILFIHGMWHNQRCWDEFIPFFTEAGFTCYSFNLTKHGEERQPKQMRRQSIKRYLMDVNTAIQQIEGDVILIGHSMGGFLIQKYMEKNKVDYAFLLTPVPHTGTFLATIRFASRYPLTFLKMIFTFDMIEMINDKKRYARMFLTKGTDVDSQFIHVNNESFRAYMDTMVFNLPRIKKIKKLNFDSRIFIYAADDDAFFDDDELKKTARKLNAEFREFDDLGHNLLVGPGSDKVAQSILKELQH
ncbi:MAG: alpha/beta fold hydrolase [Candidatus Heimdallarchaeota archaeon]|nr:alpha/beta fold hydrolase [Candidatus Heimdallarchaeota archaeon]